MNAEESGEFAGRLKAVRRALKKTQTEMDTLLGLGKKSWQRYESGGIPPGKQVFDALSKQGVNINYLFTGDPPMLLTGQAREAHIEMTEAVLMERPEAIHRREHRLAEEAASYGDRHVKSDMTVEGMIDTLQFRPPAVVTYALKQALSTGDLTLGGCLAILTALKTAASDAR